MHLLTCLKKYYDRVTTDWKGELYAGINIEWNYEKRRVKASTKGCVTKLRQQFNHKMPTKPVHSPYKVAPKVYGAEAHNTIEEEASTELTKDGINIVQQIDSRSVFIRRKSN